MWSVEAHWRRVAAVVACSLLGMLALAGAASGASFTVNSRADVALPSPTSKTCPATCTLREAVQAADNTGGANTIKVPAGTYKLTIPSTGADDPSTGDLDIYNTNGSTGGVHLTITGVGASSTILNANHLDRYFAIDAPADSLSISGVTVESGNQNDMAPSSNSTSHGDGGAFYNDGRLSVQSSVLTSNSAWGGGGVVYADTGASATSITNSVITGNNSESNGGVVCATSGSITLTNDTITHSSATAAGGVLYDDETGNTVGAVTIGTSGAGTSTISDNVASSEAGALYLGDAGTVSLTNTTVSDDSADDANGGAIYDSNSGRLTVTDSTLDDNTAGDSAGGAVYMDGTDLTVSGSTFSGNEGWGGGAIYVDGSSATALQTITTSAFSDNQGTSNQAGAIYDAAGDLSISRSTFTGNNAALTGGAMEYESGDGLSLTNDTFDGNQAGVTGGAIYFYEAASTGTIALVNDTIARNTAYDGGGIADPEYANSIENTIVADNSGATISFGGGDCYNDSPTDNAGSADKGGNLDSDGSCFSAASDQVAKDPLLGSLAYNGGPLAGAPGEQVGLQTDALQAASPAIGHAIAAHCPAVDERGVARPKVQGKCDIGAFQAAPATLSLSKSAPSSASARAAFHYTITVSDHGPGPSTTTTITDQLPAHTTLYGANPSQGACSSSGSPAKVTCDLGVVGKGASAKVVLLVSVSKAGKVTNTARASNAQGGSAHASATTKIKVAKTSGTHSTARTGAASHVSKHAAKLAGHVSTGGQPTSYFFQYGTSKSYGTVSAVTRINSSKNISRSISGLTAGRKYHYRLVAVSGGGTSYGSDKTLTT